MRCLFDSPAAACKQLKLFRHDGTQAMVCRAHNHRRADEGRWYVVPSGEWPPYAHACFFADWDPRVDKSIRVGTLLYRGIHQSLATQLTKPAGKAVVHARHWRWRELIMDPDPDFFIEPLVHAASTVDTTMRIEISTTQLAPDVGGDPYDAERDWDRIVFTLDKSGSLAVETEEGDAGTLKSLAKVDDIDVLRDALSKLETGEWGWTEVCCYVSLGTAKKTAKRASKKAAAADRVVTTHELYESLLAPFEVWLFD